MTIQKYKQTKIMENQKSIIKRTYLANNFRENSKLIWKKTRGMLIVNFV